MKETRRIPVMILMIAGLFFIQPTEASANAADFVPETWGEIRMEEERLYEKSLEEWTEQLDLSEVEQFLKEADPGIEVEFQTLFHELIQEHGQLDAGWLISGIWDFFTYELRESRTLFVQILLLCIAFAVLNNFAAAFKNGQIHQTCFFLYYLSLITLVMRSYAISARLLTRVMESLVGFMQVLTPAFCITLSGSGAFTSATVFYQGILLITDLIQRILLYLILPGIHIYVLLQVMNCLTKEQMLGNMTSLVKKVISWSLKVLVGAVAGIHLMQNLMAPAVDHLKYTAMTKALGIIPGAGDAADAVSSLFLGSALIIKNGLGITALVVLLILSMSPLVKLTVLILLYKLTGALIQPVADKRVCGCMDGVGEGMFLLLKVLVTGMLMFMIAIAMAVASVR